MEAGTERDVALAESLAALASPTRIALLREIQSPKLLRDIEVGSTTLSGDARVISRQTVRDHLDRLIQAGVVKTRDVPRGGGYTQEYLVNPQSIFLLCEEMRELARLKPTSELDVATVGGSAAGAGLPSGPSLVVVKGIEEGAAFPLPPPATGQASWIVGRRRGVPISLDFDPHISAENAVVTWEAGRFAIEDVAGSRNGTFVNFARVLSGERRALAHGDIVGVGRTLLVFRKDSR